MAVDRDRLALHIVIGVPFILAVLLPVITQDVYFLHTAIIIFFNVMMAVSLRLIMSTGQLNLAHAGFAVIGGYTSVLLAMRANLSFWIALPLGGLVAALVAVVVGRIILRVKAVYFAMITVCLGEVVRLVIVNSPQTLGGMNGISNVPKPDAIYFGLFTADFAKGRLPYYYLAFFLMVVTVTVIYQLGRSRHGRIFASIEQNDELAQSIGINIMSYKTLAFAIGSFFAGLGGSFYFHYSALAHPDFFTLWKTIDFVIFVTVGGMGSVAGPVIGALLLTVLSEILRTIREYEPLIYAGFLIVVILFLPGGLISLPQQVRGWFRIQET